jgi:hypothetical protein
VNVAGYINLVAADVRQITAPGASCKQSSIVVVRRARASSPPVAHGGDTELGERRRVPRACAAPRAQVFAVYVRDDSVSMGLSVIHGVHEIPTRARCRPQQLRHPRASRCQLLITHGSCSGLSLPKQASGHEPAGPAQNMSADKRCCGHELLWAAHSATAPRSQRDTALGRRTAA